MITDLGPLEQRSIFIIREVNAQFKKPAILWSTGKDSTAMLFLIRKAFFGTIPWPVVHLDSNTDFDESYQFRSELSEKWNFDLRVAKYPKPIKQETDLCHCTKYKIDVLKKLLKKERFDALFVSIRWDEQTIRGKERYWSPRTQNFQWVYKNQPPELWNLFSSDFGPDASHVRIHPMLHWSEHDIWNFIKQENIPVNPLYFSREGKRYRSIGCKLCSIPLNSQASTLNQIIVEVETNRGIERTGRFDKNDPYIMERLRSMGYM